MTKHKKLTSKCGITIPKDIRANYGMMSGQAVDLVEVPDGILIRKHTPTCWVCEGIENVKEFFGFELCGDCRAAIAELDKEA